MIRTDAPLSSVARVLRGVLVTALILSVSEPVSADDASDTVVDPIRVRRGYPLGRTFSPLTPEVVAHLREIAEARDRRDDVFAKVGDSMSQSRAFMGCFAREHVDLGGRDHLRHTIEHFRHGNAGGDDPFRRDSEATRVGWSTFSVIRGTNSPLVRELRRTRPRFATLMFGTNDMEWQRPWRYARSMWRVVDRLSDNGTIPIVSSILPRGDERAKDAQVFVYNLISRALAEGRRVPYIDYHREMEQLPHRGLAGDRLHANVRVVDGRARACDFSEEGLRYGHNVRNLLHIRMLDRLRRVVLEGEPAPEGFHRVPAAAPEHEGTREAPFEIRQLPHTRMVGFPAEGAHTYRFRVGHPLALRVLAISKSSGPAALAVHALDDGEARPEPVRDRDGMSVELTPGDFELTVRPPEELEPGDEYILLVWEELPEVLRRNPYVQYRH